MLVHLPLLPVLIPLLTALLIPVVGRTPQRAWALATIGTALSALSSLALLRQVIEEGRLSYWLGNWEPPWGIEYAVDPVNGFVAVIVSGMALLVAIYSARSLRTEIPEEKISLFYGVYMLLVTGLLGIVLPGDIFNLYVFLEISSISGYVLVAIGKRREALIASYNYLILGTIGATFILLGIGYLYMMTGTLNMADLRERLIPLYDSRVILTAFAFLTIGLSIKLALFPFHIWLPDAYTHAPSVVTAFMASTSTKVGAYALIRVMYTVFSPRFYLEVVPVSKLLLVLALVAIVVGPLMAIAQSDLRRMLAYSSVGQIGYIVAGISIGNQTGMIGGLIHLFNHAIMKGGLFLIVGLVLYRTGITQVDQLRGMGRRMPLAMAGFTICALSMIGLPLTVGFVSKWYLALGALEAGIWPVVPVILISSLLTAVYFWRILEPVYFTEAEGAGQEREEKSPLSMMVPAFGLALLCLVFGLFPSLPVSVTELGAALLLEQP